MLETSLSQPDGWANLLQAVRVSRDGATGTWTNLTSGASQIALGDMDGDGKADLVGLWPGNIWVKYSATGKWTSLGSAGDSIACGDLNGDGKSDLLGIWGGSVWALDSATGKWTLFISGASQVIAGDLDGDGKDDLVGIWADSGVWVKYSSSGGGEIYDQEQGTNLSKTLTALPMDGKPLYVRLWSLQGSTWRNADYIFLTTIPQKP